MRGPFILLINPWIHDFAAYDLWVKPLGLLYIAAVLRKNGFGVHLLDCLSPHHPGMDRQTVKKKPARKKTGQGHFFKQEIIKPQNLKNIHRKYSKYGIFSSVFDHEVSSLPAPAAVIISSMMTYWYPGVFEVVTRVRSIYPEVPVLLGGIYATLCFDHATRFSGVDAVIKSPGEAALFKKLEAITGKGLLYRPDFHNLDALPYPAHDLMTSRDALPLLTARGCPFSCTYCASSMLNPHFMQRDPLKVADEITYWVNNHGTQDVIFYDDALLVNADRHLIPLLKAIAKRNLPVRFHLPNGIHIKHLTQEIADLMQQTNFRTLRLGLETADAHLQKTTGGKVSVPEFTAASKIVKKAGFSAKEVGVYILAGLPKQEALDVRKTITLVKSEGLRPMIAEYSPIPGTALWDQAVACSSLPIAKEPLFQNNTLLPCRWEKFTLDDLKDLKREARAGLQ